MILVVDDDVHAKALCDFLELMVDRTTLVARIAEVPAYLEQNAAEISVVVLDILMPDQDLVKTLKALGEEIPDPKEESGLLLYRYIRRKYPLLRIVVHSVVRAQRVVEQFMNSQTTYLPKPAQLPDILQSVRGRT